MQESALLGEQKDRVAQPGKLMFDHWPAFARFIRDNYLEAYIQEQIHISREIKLPMLRFFEGMTDVELIAMSKQSHFDFLTCIENNRLEKQLQDSLALWKADQLGVIARDEIMAEDITLTSFVRKKALIKFIPFYTADVNEAIAIINDIDGYNVESDTQATNVYIDLLRERIQEQRHFSETIANTTPGINYVFDIVHRKVKYGNRNGGTFTGLSMRDTHDAGDTIMEITVHPDDMSASEQGLEKCAMSGNGEIVSWDFRMKDRDGNYRWMRNYCSPFKRDAANNVIEVVGIIMDVDHEIQTAKELAASEKLLKQAQALSHIGSWSIDLATNKYTWSEELFRIYETEYTDTIDPEIMRQYRHPDDAAMIDERMSRFLDLKEPYDFQYRIILPSGHLKYLQVKGEVMFEDRKPIKFFGTVQDVTERQKIVQKLEESEALYKQAQAIGHMGNWSWNMETLKLTWSDELYHIYGLPPQLENASSVIGEFNHPEDREIVTTAIEEAVKTGKPFDMDYRIVLKDGTEKTLNAKGQVAPRKDGIPLTIYGTLQDVTEQKHKERQLREYKEFIEKIANVTPCIIATYNIHTGKYSFINSAIKQLLGYEPDDVFDRGTALFMELIHPDDLPALLEKHTGSIRQANKMPGDEEPIVDFTYRMRHKNGEYRYFTTYGTVFERNYSGQIESVLNISVDITEQEKAKQQLALSNIQLQQSNTSLEEYAYVAGHDLKEPLRKISIFGERLLATQKDRLNNEGKAFLDKMIDAANRMHTMISDLLSVSVIQGNKSFERFSLQQLLDESLKTLDLKIEENNASIYTDNLPDARIVPSQFRQLFQNLIGNSLKFARKNVHPEISITHRYLAPADVKNLNVAKADRYLQISIADNGIGFSNQFATRIFNIFQRLHTSEYEGTGIGLALCKRIAENHGGTITAAGTPGQGAEFRIVIPA